jgi:8-amino-7-oxononanoate synthase
VLGEHGQGALNAAAKASDRVIYLATLGKAAGVFGAAVAAHPSVIDWLVNRARTYIYTTAMPPLLGAALSESLRLIAAGDARRERLHRHIERLQRGLFGLKRWSLMNSSTPIQPLLVGENEAVLNLSRQLLERGLLVPAIRTPTVPKGTARLRISLSAAHSDEDLESLIGALLEFHRD